MSFSQLVVGSRASALLSSGIVDALEKSHFIDGLPRPTSGLSRTALTREPEGETAPAAEVGAKPQRSAEKTERASVSGIWADEAERW
jgi:hypothetical protein